MKKRKRVSLLAAVLVLAMMCALTGCGGTSTPASGAGDPMPADSTAASYEFSLAHHHAVDSITDHLCNNFADLVAEKTNGAVKITVYPSAQLGTEQEVADGLLVGTQQFAMVTAAGTYVDSVDGFGVDALPFMFSSWDQINYALNETAFGEAMNEKLIAAGARILTYVPCGGRELIFVDKEITSYKQLAGMTLRSPESTLYTSMFEALGASPTPITWSECYSAMQTKVADGMDTPISSIKDMNFCEVTKYGLMTNHMWSVMTIIVNESIYQSLPEEYQRALEEAAAEAGAASYEEAMAAETDDLEYCKSVGMVFHELPEGEAEELSELMMGMKEKWLAGHEGRQELFDLCMQAIEEYNAK